VLVEGAREPCTPGCVQDVIMTRVPLPALLVLAGCSCGVVVENKLSVTVPPESLRALRSALPTDEGPVRRIEFRTAFHPADQAVAIIHYAPMREARSVTYTRRFFRNQRWPRRPGGQGMPDYKRSLREPGIEWSPTSATPHRYTLHVFRLGRAEAEVYLDRGVEYDTARKLLEMLPDIRIPSGYANRSVLAGPVAEVTWISKNADGGFSIWWGNRGLVVQIVDGKLLMKGICRGCS